MRSDRTKKGLERMPHRALYCAAGVPQAAMGKPFIGVATSFTDLVPGHVGMRVLERVVENGVHAAGGYPFLFGVPAVCDGIAMGHRGMHYSLPLRELIADMIESVAEAHALDGLVLLTNCDKITPGMLMAAARLSVPSIVLTAGPMLSGRMGDKRLSLVSDTFEAVGRYQRGEIDAKMLDRLEAEACPGEGSCQGLYTANTMACLTETLGMSLPGCATALAGMSKKRHIGYATGKRIVGLVRKGITPRRILTRAAFENAIRVDLALGGSSNSVLHLLAIAHEAGVRLPLAEFDRLSRETPQLTTVTPAGPHMMEDVEFSGGIPAILNRLLPRLKKSLTVSGEDITAVARKGRVVNDGIIRKVSAPVRPEGGIAVLTGNLAPEGAVVKQSGVDPKMFTFRGKARVFDSEDAAMAAIMDVIPHIGHHGDGAGDQSGPHHRRAILGWNARAVHRPRLSRGDGRGGDRTREERGRDRPGHPEAEAHAGRPGEGVCPPEKNLECPAAEGSVGVSGPVRNTGGLGGHRSRDPAGRMT
jgi:dihydroxy-acid dehydratase